MFPVIAFESCDTNPPTTSTVKLGFSFKSTAFSNPFVIIVSSIVVSDINFASSYVVELASMSMHCCGSILFNACSLILCFSRCFCVKR